jgi:hypothetical protein
MTTFNVLHARDDARQRRVAALHGLNEHAGGRDIKGGQELLEQAPRV